MKECWWDREKDGRVYLSIMKVLMRGRLLRINRNHCCSVWAPKQAFSRFYCTPCSIQRNPLGTYCQLKSACDQPWVPWNFVPSSSGYFKWVLSEPGPRLTPPQVVMGHFQQKDSVIVCSRQAGVKQVGYWRVPVFLVFLNWSGWWLLTDYSRTLASVI